MISDSELLKELQGSTNQLLLFRANDPKKKLPKKLEEKLAYLRGYYTAVRTLDKMKKDGTLDGINWINFERRISISLGRLPGNFI